MRAEDTNDESNSQPSEICELETSDTEIDPLIITNGISSIEPWHHPNRVAFRYAILALNCFSVLGGYYADISIAVISTDLIRELQINQVEYGTLFSIYSFPNMIMVMFGGILLDKVGLRIGLILYLSLISLGSLTTAASAYLSNPHAYYLMLVGRFIFGLGAEPAFIAQDMVCVVWFKGTTLAFSMSLVSSFGRIGEIVSFNSAASIADYFGDFRKALWCSFGITLLSLICGILLVCLDAYGESRVQNQSNRSTSETLRFSDIRKFPSAYWVLLLLTVTYFGAIYPFISFASDFLQFEWGWGEEKAGSIVSILSFVAMIVSPMFGLMLDKAGKRAIVVSIASILMTTSLLLMAFTHFSPLMIMGIMGLAYAMLPAAIFPSLALIVPENKFATAYGLMMAAANSGLVLFYYLIGLAVDRTLTPTVSLVIMAVCAFLAFLLSLLWNYLDYSRMDSLANNAPIILSKET